MQLRADWQQNLALLVLAPILFVEGRYARFITPKLQEPAGPRMGQRGRGHILRLLILGDSAAAGVGASHQDEALAGQLTRELSKTHAVHWRLLATTGHTARDTLKALNASPREDYDVVALSVGVNDVTAGRSVRRWLGDIDALIARLQTEFGAPHILISELPPMHLFPALPQPLRWFLGQRAQLFNAALASHLRHRPDCHFMPTAYPPEPRHIAADGFHPGPGAYAHWARMFASLIRQRLEDSCAEDRLGFS